MELRGHGIVQARMTAVTGKLAKRTLLVWLIPIFFVTGSSMPARTAEPATASSAPQKDLGKKISHIRDMLHGGLSQAKANFTRFAPGDNYRKTLPAETAVLASKDQKAFQSYGGLSEVYLFDGEEDKANQVLTWLSANNASMLGAENPYLSLVYNDFGLYYWNKKSPDEAEKMLTQALPVLEKASQSDLEHLRGNMISLYGTLAVLYFDKDQKELAQYYFEKLKPLTHE
jgi:hypothetical protein